MFKITNKWFHTRRSSISIEQDLSNDITSLHVVSIIQEGGSTSDPQLQVIIKQSKFPHQQDYQVDDPCYDIGGGALLIGIMVKDHIWYLKSNTSGVIPTHVAMSIKNVRFKSEPSTLMHSFVTVRCISFN